MSLCMAKQCSIGHMQRTYPLSDGWNVTLKCDVSVEAHSCWSCKFVPCGGEESSSTWQHQASFHCEQGRADACACAERRDCQFSLNQSAPQTLEVQLGVQGYWAMCSQECKQEFLKNWLHVHFEVANQRFGEGSLLSLL